MNVDLSSAQRERVMPVGKVGKRRNIVIPQVLCDEVGIREGDYVEMQVVNGGVLVRPKRLVDPTDVREEAASEHTHTSAP